METQENLQKKWNLVLDILQNKTTDAFFNIWILNLQIKAYEDGIIYLLAQNKTHCTRIEEVGKDDIISSCKDVFGEKVTDIKVLLKEDFEKMDSFSSLFKKEEKVEEIKIDNNFLPKYTFENFIVGKNNDIAYAGAKSVAENPSGKWNPLFIYSGVGLGKTHLLHAIGIHLNKTKPHLKVLYITCQKFIVDYVNSIKSGQSNINEFREKYRNIDVLLIDDIQFLEGKKETQEEFFHTFKDLYEAGKQIVITSDKSPDNISTLEDRLRSRFKGGLIQDIIKPDFETKIAILEKKAEQENYNIEESAITFIAEKMDTNVREMEAMLGKVAFYANLKGKHFAQLEDVVLAMKEVVQVDTELLTAEKIIDVVSEYYGISRVDILGKKKTKDIADARQVAIYLICEMLGMPLVNIGKIFNGRDHTTIMHSRDKITNEIKENIRIRQCVEDIKENLKNIKS